MADPIQIYEVCGKCHGDGQFPNDYVDPTTGEVIPPEETYTCNWCAGSGVLLLGLIPASFQEQIDDMQDQVNDVLDKCNDIFEKLNE